MPTIASRGTGVYTTVGSTWAATANLLDGAVGTTPGTFATQTSATPNGVGHVEVEGYHTAFAAIPAGSVINTVTVRVRHKVITASRWVKFEYQPYDGTSPLGTFTAGTISVTVHDDSATFPVLLAQLKSVNFRVRFKSTRSASSSSDVWSIDHIDVEVDYTPPGGTAHPLTGATVAITATSGTIGLVAGAQAHPLAGTVAGTSTTSGNPAATHPLAGVLPGTTTTTGTIRSALPLTGTVAGITTTVGSPAARHPLVGVAAAISTSSGTINKVGGAQSYPLAGVVPAVTATAGNPTVRYALLGTVAGTTTTSGTIQAMTMGGRPKAWTGAAWAVKPGKVWNGSAWVEKPWKTWSGSAWEKV